MNKQGILTIISGFSGVGKGTIVNRLLEIYPEDYCLSISVTTRKPRTGEVHGRNYFFLSQEDFKGMIEAGELLEYAEYVDNFYGTPKQFVVDKLVQGINVILEIEMQGALEIKAQYPQTLLLFVAPPSAQDLEVRLRARNTEGEEEIVKRLNRALEETIYIPDYDYMVINDELDCCTRDIHTIIESEKNRVFRNKESIAKLEAELKSYVKGD